MDWLETHMDMLRKLQRGNNSHCDFEYSSMEDLLLRHGRRWKPRPLPAKWKDRIIAYPKACFDNAYRLAARSRGELRYVEGLAVGIIPVHHAWCVDAKGYVVDPTWGSFRTEIGSIYHGVVLPLDVMKKLRTKKNTSGIMDYVHGYPLLKEKFTYEQEQSI